MELSSKSHVHINSFHVFSLPVLMFPNFSGNTDRMSLCWRDFLKKYCEIFSYLSQFIIEINVSNHPNCYFRNLGVGSPRVKTACIFK